MRRKLRLVDCMLTVRRTIVEKRTVPVA